MKHVRSLTFASGGSFSKYSHEFQTVTDAGEDIVYIDKEKNIAINEEVYTDEVISDLGLSKDTLVKEKAAEVGNIFSLGTKFSDAHNTTFTSAEGKDQSVIMGSYGIGLEVLWDDRDARPGQKFADSDLIGIPHRVVLSPKTIEAGGVEHKKRTEQEGVIISIEDLFDLAK